MVQHTFSSVLLLLLLLLLCLLWLGNKKFCNNAAHERPLVFCLALCLIACAVSSCACVCGWFLIEVTSKNLLDDLFFCDNRVMAKRTTLLTIVFRVNNEKYPSAERRSSASVLHTHDWINAFQCGPPGILSVMSSCLYGTSRPCEGILSACPLPVVAAAWLHFLMHLDRAQISLVSFRCSYGFCFSRCSLRVLLSCLFLCSRRLDSDLLARVLSAWFSFSFHLICDAYAMQSLAG